MGKAAVDNFVNASLEDIKRGYEYEIGTEEYTCLICGKTYIKGVVYPEDETYFDAEKSIKMHISREHTSVFDYLLNLDKKITGLTEYQKELLVCFNNGLSDKEIIEKFGGGSTSTIRNYRFTFREKEKQAKIFLAIMELVGGKQKDSRKKESAYSLGIAAESKSSVGSERDKILKKYFQEGLEGPLNSIPKDDKNREMVFEELIRRFHTGRKYSEKEVNEILRGIYEDYVTLRRYMVDFGFLERESDGSLYWVKETGKERKEDKSMDRRKEMILAYKQSIIPAGVYQIKNNVNGKVFIGTSPNLRAMGNRYSFALKLGNHMNSNLQKEWNEIGGDNFTYEVLEEVDQSGDKILDIKDELKKLEKKWLEKLQPYDEKGYNKRPDVKKK